MACSIRGWLSMASSVAPPLAPAAGAKRRRRKAGVLLAQLRDPYALIGASIYLSFLLVAIFADRLASYDPTEILFTEDGGLASALPPSPAHWLGTTNLGRDVFSQLVLGARPSLFVGVTAALAVAAIGTVVGLITGYLGGIVDRVLMRLADMVLGLPLLPLLILPGTLLPASPTPIVFAGGLLLLAKAARRLRRQRFL